MSRSKCPRCLQVIGEDDTVSLSSDRVVHVDCQRPRDLTLEERVLLVRYCWGHAVAKCPACDQRFRQQQLGSDLLGHRTHMCPRCRTDLTESLRGHLYACAMLPEEVRRRAQGVRDVARRLVKQSHQLSDRADVLTYEAEAAMAALRETMQRLAKVRTVVGMPDELRLREQAREAIRNGRLPARPPDRNLTQHGRSGASCPICRELVMREQLEVEIQFRRQELGWDCYHIHPRCFAAWEFECNKL